MFAPRWQADPLTRTIEVILDDLASPQATSERRLDLLSRLEGHFGRAVLPDEATGERDAAATHQSAWWHAQTQPRSCVAQGLIALLHRLHLVALHSSRSASSSSHNNAAPTTDDPSDEMSACFTMLQGLCLKYGESGRICTSRSTLELLLAILGAAYWQRFATGNDALAHAIDLLICATMASRTALLLFDALKGEDVIRALMERHTLAQSSGSKAGEGRRTITLDVVQGSPIAIKCAEFLLLFASERDEPATRSSATPTMAANGKVLHERVAGQTSLIADTSIARGLPRPRRLAHLERRPRLSVEAQDVPITGEGVGSGVVRRTRSVSPRKMYEKRHRVSTAPVSETEGETPRIRRSVPATTTKTTTTTTARAVSDGSFVAERRSMGSSPLRVDRAAPILPRASTPPPASHRSPAKLLSAAIASHSRSPRKGVASTPFAPLATNGKAGNSAPRSTAVAAVSPDARGRRLYREEGKLTTDVTAPLSPIKRTAVGSTPVVLHNEGQSVSPRKRFSQQHVQ